MADYPAMPFWKESRPLHQQLADEGWLSPDTYSNFFAPVRPISAIYLFLAHEPVFLNDAFVAYAGMTSDLRRRWSKHEILTELRSTDFWIMRWFKATPARRLREAEGAEITRFAPPWNVLGKRRGIALQ